MVKLVFVFLFVSLALFDGLELATMECAYEYYEFRPLGSIYYCWVQNYVNIKTREQAFIDSASGGHNYQHTNENVVGIWLRFGVSFYFPHNLTKIYPDLKAVSIRQSWLREIQQSDMKTIPKLEHLTLSGNDIKILDDGLFDFNPELKYIDMGHNHIYSIGTQVFDNLNDLQNLNLEGNTCVKSSGKYDYVYDQNTPLLEDSKEIALTNCSGPAFFELKENLKILKRKSKNIKTKNFKNTYENIRTEVINSKLNKSITLHGLLNDLKDILNEKVSNKGSSMGHCKTLLIHWVIFIINLVKRLGWD